MNHVYRFPDPKPPAAAAIAGRREQRASRVMWGLAPVEAAQVYAQISAAARRLSGDPPEPEPSVQQPAPRPPLSPAGAVDATLAECQRYADQMVSEADRAITALTEAVQAAPTIDVASAPVLTLELEAIPKSFEKNGRCSLCRDVNDGIFALLTPGDVRWTCSCGAKGFAEGASARPPSTARREGARAASPLSRTGSGREEFAR